MKLRAVIFDVYQTVLEVGPPPVDREDRWHAMVGRTLGILPRLRMSEFNAACEQVIGREHARARAAGVPHPEIFWPDVVTKVLPELAKLPVPERDDFLFQQQSLFHTVRLMPGAAAVLRRLCEQGILMGIASNAQPYTRRELAEALLENSIPMTAFTEEICFWSYEHGFSKPDPHVFRLLSARLRIRGIQPAETLMVGDRADNDIDPAREQGWQTWQLTTSSCNEFEGGWSQLDEFIARRT